MREVQRHCYTLLSGRMQLIGQRISEDTPEFGGHSKSKIESNVTHVCAQVTLPRIQHPPTRGPLLKAEVRHEDVPAPIELQSPGYVTIYVRKRMLRMPSQGCYDCC